MIEEGLPMWDKRTPLQKADVFIWTGEDALRIWDRRRGQEQEIPFDHGQKVPYVPRFHLLWEDPKHYQEALRRALGRGKKRILLAAPDDATFIERTALEDFICVSLGRRLRRGGLTICSHSVSLGKPSGQYIAATRTARCYCVALVKDGAVVDSQLLDAHRSERGALEWEIRDFRDQAGEPGLKVRYPETEEDWTLMGLGKSVSFARIATMDKKKGGPPVS